MIDTDKYEGHTPAPWKINEIHSSQRWTGRKPVDVLLAEDAPLLLAEVKRLREGIVNALIPTEAKPIIHPLVKLGDLRKALKELIE